jgi:hypothetical protein
MNLIFSTGGLEARGQRGNIPPNMRRLETKTIPSLLLAALILQANGCHEAGVFPSLENTTEIVIEDVFTSNREIKRITDPARISRIVAFVNGLEKGWQSPWYDLPIPKIRVVFYDHQRKVGTLSVGADFFSSGAYLKPASEQEVEQALKLMELDKGLYFKD